jgi:hypothetical protein
MRGKERGGRVVEREGKTEWFGLKGLHMDEGEIISVRPVSPLMLFASNKHSISLANSKLKTSKVANFCCSQQPPNQDIPKGEKEEEREVGKDRRREEGWNF